MTLPSEARPASSGPSNGRAHEAWSSARQLTFVDDSSVEETISFISLDIALTHEYPLKRPDSDQASGGPTRSMEKNPWYKNVEGPFLQWKGPVGIKEDGGGCTRAQGRVGNMVVHRAAFNKNAAAIKKAVENGEDVNEVEGAGNTPLHCAAYAGWEEGCELLLSLGAKVNASNNAGDRPWHWAQNMGQKGVMSLLEKAGASKEHGQVLVQDHVPKVKDFYQKECWAHHPKPHADYIEWRLKQDKQAEAERNKLIPGM